MLNTDDELHRVQRCQTPGLVLVCLHTLLALTACGDGSNAADLNLAVIQPPSNPIWSPRFAGGWLENSCVTIGTESFRRLLRATDLPDTQTTRLTYSEGVTIYPNTTCSNAGVQAAPSAMGAVDFSRWDWSGESNLSAYWGSFTTVTNTTSQVVWVRKGDNLLCLLGDQTPSIFPDLNAIAASLKTLPDLGCFTRL